MSPVAYSPIQLVRLVDRSLHVRMLDEPKLRGLHVWRTRHLARAVLAMPVPGQRIPARQIGLQVLVARFQTPIVRVRSHHCDYNYALTQTLSILLLF